MQDDQPIPGWRPKMGERMVVVATNRAAKVTAELLHGRFEVEPGGKYGVYSLGELRYDSPLHGESAARRPRSYKSYAAARTSFVVMATQLVNITQREAAVKLNASS